MLNQEKPNSSPKKKYILAGGIAAICIAATATFFLISQNSANYKYASADYTLSFPRDHASHPDYQNEWWYYTGHLDGDNGERYGFQITFFRVGLTPDQQKESRWRSNTFYFGHFALTDKEGKKFYYTEKISRGGEFDDTEARTDIYKVRLGNWRGEILGNAHHLEAVNDSAKISLNILAFPQKAPALQGTNGYSQKSADPKNASMYYSLTRNTTSGVLIIDNKPVQVSGTCWMDHEFGTSQLAADQTGWDWFSLQLADSTELMLFQIRKRDGKTEEFSHGSFIDRKGVKTELRLGRDYAIEVLEQWTSKNGTKYPSKWKIKVPSQSLELVAEPYLNDQELRTENSTRITYWEGAVKVNGTKQGSAITGEGYTELTGYAQEFRGLK